MSNDTSTEAKCPFHHTATTGEATTDHNWWPNRLKVELLHQHSAKSDPMGGDFNYAEEFKSLDLAALKKDLARPTSRCGWIRFTRKSRVIF